MEGIIEAIPKGLKLGQILRARKTSAHTHAPVCLCTISGRPAAASASVAATIYMPSKDTRAEAN